MSSDGPQPRGQLKCPKCQGPLQVRRGSGGAVGVCSVCKIALAISRTADGQLPEAPLAPVTVVAAPAGPPVSPADEELGYEVDWESNPPRQSEPAKPRVRHSALTESVPVGPVGPAKRERDQYTPRWTFFSGVFLFPWTG